MPSVSITTTPQQYSPIYPNVWFGTTSTASNTADFKYLYRMSYTDLSVPATYTSQVYPIPPRPNGQGLFSPSRLLASLGSFSFHPSTLVSNDVLKPVIPYSIGYGFQYNPTMSFANIGNNSTSDAWLKSATSLDLQVNDEINILMDNQTINYGYNGEATIVATAFTGGFYQYRINKTYVSAAASQSGIINSQRRFTGTSSTYYAYDGTRQYTQIGWDFGSYFVFDNTNNYCNALNNYYPNIIPPDISQLNQNAKKILPYQNETVSVLISPTFSGQHKWSLYDSNKTLLNSVIRSVATTAIRQDVAVGTKNLTNGSQVAYPITSALLISNYIQLDITDGGTRLPIGTTFDYVASGGGGIGLPSHGTAHITGWAVTLGRYITDIYNAGPDASSSATGTATIYTSLFSSLGNAKYYSYEIGRRLQTGTTYSLNGASYSLNTSLRSGSDFLQFTFTGAAPTIGTQFEATINGSAYSLPNVVYGTITSIAFSSIYTTDIGCFSGTTSAVSQTGKYIRSGIRVGGALVDGSGFIELSIPSGTPSIGPNYELHWNGSPFCMGNTSSLTITGNPGGNWATDLVATCNPEVGTFQDGILLPTSTPIPVYSFVSKMIKFYEIIDNCSPYSNFRLVFMNRNGGADYWNFNYKHTNSMSVSRSEYRKVLAYDYKVGDRQDTILSTQANESYDISSDWITEYDMNYLKELLTSKEVFLYDDSDGQKLPIIITTTSWNVKTTIDNKVFACSLSFRMAFDINLQNN